MRCKCCNLEFETSRYILKQDGSEEDLCRKCRGVVKSQNKLNYKWYQFEGATTGLTEVKQAED